MKKAKKKTKKFDMVETEEAMEYFFHRFSSRDVTIARSGPFIHVDVGDVNGPEFVVTREPDGWLVWRNDHQANGKIVSEAARSYEQAAIAIEKDMGW